jgi:hypothetical protein
MEECERRNKMSNITPEEAIQIAEEAYIYGLTML